jgi:O-antigen/teichoic acid export membrane protein
LHDFINCCSYKGYIIKDYSSLMTLKRVSGEIVRHIPGRRRLSGEILWVVTGQAISVIGALVGIKLLTELLPPKAYGELALAMTAATLANQTILGPLSNACTRFFAPANEAREVTQYLKAVSSLTVAAAMSLIVLGVLAVFVLEVAGHGTWVALVAATFAFAVISGCNAIMDGMQTAARQRSVVALHQGFGTWLRFLCAVWLIDKLGVSSFAAMCGYGLGSLFTAISQGCFFTRGIVHPLSFEHEISGSALSRWKPTIIDYAVPISIWGMFTWMYMASDRWALQAFASTEDVGRYAVLYQLGYYPMMLVSGIVSQFLAPIFFQISGDATDPLRRRTVSQTNHVINCASLGFTMFAVAVAAILHAQIFQVLTSQAYLDVSWLLPAVVLAGGLFGTGQLAAMETLSNQGSRDLIKPKIVTAVLGVALNVTCAATWGVTGIVVAGTIFAGAYLGWVIWLNCYSESASGGWKASKERR